MFNLQLEALLLSLILSGLFLLIVTLTLLRIVCHFKDKPFYKTGSNIVPSKQVTATQNSNKEICNHTGSYNLTESRNRHTGSHHLTESQNHTRVRTHTGSENHIQNQTDPREHIYTVETITPL